MNAKRQFYKLVGRTPIVCEASEGRIERLRRDRVAGLSVSTVFLGIDVRLDGEGPAKLFETAVFGPGSENFEMRHYATYDEAETGHREVVAQVRRRLLGASNISLNVNAGALLRRKFRRELIKSGASFTEDKGFFDSLFHVSGSGKIMLPLIEQIEAIAPLSSEFDG